MEEQKQIAQTILEQLKWGSIARFWSWGGHNWMFLPESRDYRGGLHFTVSGAKYQGNVQVLLNWVDTYVVKLGDKVLSDVYCDQLAEIIDGLVETD